MADDGHPRGVRALDFGPGELASSQQRHTESAEIISADNIVIGRHFLAFSNGAEWFTFDRGRRTSELHAAAIMRVTKRHRKTETYRLDAAKRADLFERSAIQLVHPWFVVASGVQLGAKVRAECKSGFRLDCLGRAAGEQASRYKQREGQRDLSDHE